MEEARQHPAVTYARIAGRQDLEGLRTGTMDSPEWWIVEYRLKGAEGVGPAILEIAISGDDQRSIAFGNGHGVEMDPTVLIDLIADTLDELEVWRADTIGSR